jgi:hypothetical protein
VGTGTFFRFVSTIADTVTLVPGDTVSIGVAIESKGLGYFTLIVSGADVDAA